MSLVIPLISLLLTLYTTSLIIPTISRLRQYESASKTAAQYSNTAAQKLHKTQVTQASGAAVTLFSLISSLYLLLSSTNDQLLSPLAIAALNTITCSLAYTHMAGFWNEREQTRIPLVKDFNEAIRGSEKVVLMLGTLGVSWGVAAGVWVVGMGEGVMGLAVWGGVVGVRMMGIAGWMGWKE